MSESELEIRGLLTSQISFIGWDFDGALYPNNQRISNTIQTELSSVAQQRFHQLGMDYDRTYKQMGSLLMLEYLGIDPIVFFGEIWDSLPLEEIIEPDPRLNSMIQAINDTGKQQFIIANGNRKQDIERKANIIGLDMSLFKVVIGTLDFGIHKPDPSPYLHALGILGAEAQNSIFIGDRDSDVDGAKRAGLWSIKLGERYPEADLTLEDRYSVGILFLEEV